MHNSSQTRLSLLSLIEVSIWIRPEQVPKVYVQLVLIVQNTEEVLAEKVIGWQVDESLANEAFDTRLAPNQSIEIRYQFNSIPTEGRVELRLAVAPAEHYERNYTTSLGYADKLDTVTLKLLKTAYRNAKNTRFTLMMNRIEL